MYVTVDVDVDIEDVLDEISDADLAKYGLMRTGPAPDSVPTGFTTLTPWHDVQRAMRAGDRGRLDNLISTMAWEQAGVILPSGFPLHH